MANKLPKRLSMNRGTIRASKPVRQGSWIPGAETDLRRLKRELKGRSHSDIINRLITKGLSQDTLEDKIKICVTRIEREQRRIEKLKALSYPVDSWNQKEKERKILIKETICNKLHIALFTLQNEYEKLEKRANNRTILKEATEEQVLVRLEDNKIVPAKEETFTASNELRPTGTVMKKTVIGRKPAAKMKYNQVLAAKAIKAETAETDRKERVRKAAVMREYEEFSKFKESKFEIIKKRQPKQLQDEIDRVFGLSEEEKALTEEDLVAMFGSDED